MIITENFKEFFKNNKNALVKVICKRDWREKPEKPFIGSIYYYNDKYDTIEFGHPYVLEDKEVQAGTVSIDMNEIISIDTNVSKDEMFTWLYEYGKFYNSVVEEKGYNFLTENIEEILSYYL